MDESQQQPPNPEDLDYPRKVLVVGAGIAGLFTALAFKRASQNAGVPVNVMIFERAGPSIFHEKSMDGNPAQFFILWRWAIDLLREVGLGHRLARIARPILTFKSTDAETQEVLVQWPPVDLTSTTDPAVDMGDTRLPPMVGVRRVDLLRLLLMALSQDGDEVLQKEASKSGEGKQSMSGSDTFVDFGASDSARNVDGVEFIPNPDDPYGLHVDMARDDWFERERVLDRIPFLFLGYDLASFIISASSGLVTARFANGHVEVCDMIIGADGINSKVRELIGSDRYPAHHAGSFICHGITRTLLPPPPDCPGEFSDGTVIPDVSDDDIRTLIPEGSSFSIIAGGSSLGLANLGNGQIGWNMVAAEQEEGKILQEYLQQNRRLAVSRAVARTSLGPSSFAGVVNKQTGTVDVPQTVLSTISESSRLHNDPESIQETVEPDTMAKLEGRAPQVGTQPTAFEMQIREQLAQRNSEIFDASTLAQPSTAEKNIDGYYLARGGDARALALKLLSKLPNVPIPAQALVARTDPNFTIAMDVMDMADRWLDSFTSPTFHAGRIIMIGDAAHPIATNAHNGSVGAGLAMTDGACIALLFMKYFGKNSNSPVEASTSVEVGDEDSDISTFEKFGLEFDKERCAMANNIMREARYEGAWDRVENTWFRSLLRMSYKYTPTTWVKSSYATRLTRGGVKLPDPRLSPFPPKADDEIPL